MGRARRRDRLAGTGVRRLRDAAAGRDRRRRQGCKFPGKSTDYDFGYRMVLTFHNTTGTPQPINILSFTISGKATT
ncbi:MAG: hypothetical protein WAV00_12365 [Nocardioides sp.]